MVKTGSTIFQYPVNISSRCRSDPYRTEAQRMWARLSAEDPALLEHFEGFLSDVVEELQHVHTEREKLETHVRR